MPCNDPRIFVPMVYSGWFNDGWEDDSFATAVQNAGSVLTEVSPYWYNLGKAISGKRAGAIDGSIHARWNVKASRVLALQALGLKVIPTIGDNHTDIAAGQLGAIMDSPEARETLFANLANIVPLYDGLDVNFEHVPPESRAQFTQFVSRFADICHEADRMCVVTLPAAPDLRYEQLLGYDLQALASIPGIVFRVMLYDNHYDAYGGGEIPAPIAPIRWCRQVLRYFISRGIPSQRLEAGLHNYAVVWKKDGEGKYVKIDGWKPFAEIAENDLEWRFDEEAEETYVLYENHIAYIGDETTVLTRIPLQEEFNLRGVCFWVLGREQPGLYDLLVGTPTPPSPVTPPPTSESPPRNPKRMRFTATLSGTITLEDE